MDLSIITVSWNVRDKLRENLKALYESEGDFEFEVIVIDNASADGTAEMVRNEFPQVRIVCNTDNRGFGRGNNQGIDIARADNILFLNPDMRVLPDTLIRMLGWMKDNPQAAVAGCQLVDEEGKNMPHVRQFPSFSDQLAIILKLPHLFPGLLKRYLRSDFDYGQAARTDSIRGAFFWVDRERIARLKTDSMTIPRFDERYFLWFEEVDYCRQVLEAGGETWYTPVARCIDHIGQSFNQVKRATKQNYMRDSMLKYFRKWHQGWRPLLLSFAWRIAPLMVWMLEKLKLESSART